MSDNPSDTIPALAKFASKRKQKLILLLLITFLLTLSLLFASQTANDTIPGADDESELDDLKRQELKDHSHKRLAILTLNVPPQERSYMKYAIDNHKKYAKLHNYNNYIEYGISAIGRPPVWSKITALIKHMENDKHEWFWALDMDSIIMNGSIKAENYLDDKYDLIVVKDCNGFNAGSFFIKNSEWSIKFLREVLMVESPKPAIFEEQAAMINVMEDKKYDDHFKWVAQRKFNSYPDNICGAWAPGLYEPGDFLIHFPSLSGAEWFENYFIRYYKNAVGLENISLP